MGMFRRVQPPRGAHPLGCVPTDPGHPEGSPRSTAKGEGRWWGNTSHDACYFMSDLVFLGGRRLFCAHQAESSERGSPRAPGHRYDRNICDVFTSHANDFPLSCFFRACLGSISDAVMRSYPRTLWQCQPQGKMPTSFMHQYFAVGVILVVCTSLPSAWRPDWPGGDSRPQRPPPPGRGHLRHHEPGICREVNMSCLCACPCTCALVPAPVCVCV